MENRIENLEKSPKITVIVLTYNRAKLLPRAIRSVLNQTFSNFELIVVDNASTDSTEEVVKSFDDKRIIYKKNKENEGSSGKNTGFDTARGKYVVFLDDDDELLPDAFETVVGKFTELSPKGVKILWFDCIDAETGKYSGSGIRKEGYVFYEDYLCSRIVGDYHIAIDRDMIGNNGLAPNFWGGMVMVSFMKLYRNNKMFYIPKVMCKLYREHGGSRVSNIETSLLNDVPKIILALEDFLREYGEEIKILCPKCYGQRLASLGFYQILNNEKKEGRSNVLESFRFHFSLAHCSIFMLSFILDNNQLKFICLKFFKIKEIILKF